MKDGAAVLDRVSLTIRSGEHTAIVGPNGAGKSTLVNLLTHEDSAAGAGGPWPERSRGRSSDPPLRVRPVEHVRSALAVRDRQRRSPSAVREREQRGRITARDAVLSRFFAGHGFIFEAEVTPAMHDAADTVLARMGVAHLAGTTLDRMSTGEARRVLIARALVTSPEALLLDEPTTGLDLVARYQFLESVREVTRQGTTLILVTHRVEEIIPEIETVVLLKGGRVAAAGPKAATLTGASLTAVFGAPISLTESGGYYVGAVRTVS